MKEVAIKIFLAVLSVTIMFLLTETFLRIFDKDIMVWRYDPILGYSFVPGVHIKRNQNKLFPGIEIKINSQGIRENFDIPDKKEEKEFRILIIGDSNTFGYGVNLKDSYPKQLEVFLREDEKVRETNFNYRVINAGVPGRNIEELKKFVFHYALNFKPDLLILGLFINDIEPSYFIVSGGKDVRRPPFYPSEFNQPLIGGRILPESIKEILRKYSKIYLYFESTYSNLRFFLGLDKPNDYLKKEFSDLKHLSSNDPLVIKKYEIMMQDILKIQRFLDLHNIKFLTIILPFRSQVEIKEASDNIQTNLTKFFKKNEIMFVDLLPNLKENKNRNLYLPNDGHPNKLGHQIIAEVIYKFLISDRIFNFR